MLRLFTVVSLWLLLSSLGGNFQLKKTDVRSTMEEMLAYHVEYKEFSPMLVRRSLKIYIEQFDYSKTYLLANEVQPYLGVQDRQLNGIVQNYASAQFPDYEALNQTIQQSITRARQCRQEIEQELIAQDIETTFLVEEPYSNYAGSGEELKKRIKEQLVTILVLEKQSSKGSTWTPLQRQKLFDLWERRFARMENPYLPSAGLTEHYLSLHLLRAFSKSLDAHTSYFSPEEAHEMRTSLEKRFEGIGVVLKEGVDGVTIHNMIKGAPAERCGQISRGDLLIEIDGQFVEGAPYEEVLKRLQGPPGGKIQLGLRSFQTGKTYQVNLKREKIVMQEERVSYSSEPYGEGIIGKLTLPSFYESGEGMSCEEDLKVALRALRAQGPLQGLVLDMRESSEGFLTQAVKVSGLFMTSGIVVISKYAHGITQYLRDLDGKSYYSGPLVVLTSRGSASAAEIVAQALQDYGTALVVGDDRTYGKGTIQYQTVTDPKATNFFKVTIGRYYTVSGRTTQIDGVKADIVVPTVYSVLPIGERYLEFPLRSDRIPSAYVDPLSDIDARSKPWFQKNYLPHLQKKLSVWTQMLPQLQLNSQYRLAQNKDYVAFLKVLEQKKQGKPTAKENWGVEDLQMAEAVNIVKDMATLKPKAAAEVALLLKAS